ncbi:hypothetical protein CEE45_12725 [Candidatus Heimdallarchaeota archaeon B3_Heim]|nr:MAG: hypothetical protein CEE45_12725 [Candidatus Heimdallarchaeota archaeon B3_Heim]
MKSQDTAKKILSKKPSADVKISLNDDFRIFLQENFKDVRSEMKVIAQNVRNSFMEIEKEIRDIKVLTQNNFRRLESLTEDFIVEEKEPELISTGLDILTNIPSHLRRTYKVMLTKEIGATALEVSHETGKSRPLESDYLNQLWDMGHLRKRPDPENRKRVVFFIKSSEPWKDITTYSTNNSNSPEDYIQRRRQAVRDASELK